MRRSEVLLSAEVPLKVVALRRPRPRQNASNISSNFSQSEWVAQNSERSADLSEDGRAAAGDTRIESASRVSASPTLKPLSRKLRAIMMHHLRNNQQ